MPSALQRLKARWITSGDTAMDVSKMVVKPKRQPNMRKSKTWANDAWTYALPDTSLYVDGAKHTIVLNGEGRDITFALAKKLRKKLELNFTTSGATQSWEDYSDYVRQSIVSMTKVVIPEKDLHQTADNSYELRHRESELFTTAENRQAIYYARNTGQPVEIGYMSARRNRSGALTEQTHVHRVNVKSADGVSFIAKHGRGWRRYRFDKLQWVRIEDGIFRVVYPEPVIEISFRKIAGGFIARLEIGTTANLYQPIKELANG